MNPSVLAKVGLVPAAAGVSHYIDQSFLVDNGPPFDLMQRDNLQEIDLTGSYKAKTVYASQLETANLFLKEFVLCKSDLWTKYLAHSSSTAHQTY